MARFVTKRKNVKKIILIGDISNILENSFKKAGFNHDIFMLGKSSMDKIVRESLKVTPEGGVVLLSPGSASFDMFENYKDRGKKFKDAVISLQKTLR